MALKQSVKYTLGKEDGGTPGTPVARTVCLPLADVGGLDRTLTKNRDPMIAGLGMAAGAYAVAGDVAGQIPLSPRSCAGMGHVLKGIFGGEGTPGEIVGVIRIKYTGAQASCKITTSLAGKTIISAIGAAGSESGDAAFGAAGTIDLTNASYDTIAELVAAIEGYDDYTCSLVTGSGASTITSVVGDVYQGKGRYAFLWLTGAGSGLYHHRFYPVLTIGTERATYSIQRDGFGNNYLYDGVVFDKLSIDAALKSEITASVDCLGMGETIGQEASAVAAPSSKPFIFGGGFTSLAGTQYTYVRKHNIMIDNKHNKDGYGQSEIDRVYHERGEFQVTGGLTLKNNATSILERPKVESGVALPIQLLYFAAEDTASVKQMMLIEMPYAELMTCTTEANGDSLDLAVTYEAFNPGAATDYEDCVSVHILTTDSGAY